MSEGQIFMHVDEPGGKYYLIFVIVVRLASIA